LDASDDNNADAATEDDTSSSSSTGGSAATYGDAVAAEGEAAAESSDASVAAEAEDKAESADVTAPSSGYQQPRNVVRRNAFRERLSRTSLRGRRTPASSLDLSDTSTLRKARKPGFRIRNARKNIA